MGADFFSFDDYDDFVTDDFVRSLSFRSAVHRFVGRNRRFARMKEDNCPTVIIKRQLQLLRRSQDEITKKCFQSDEFVRKWETQPDFTQTTNPKSTEQKFKLLLFRFLARNLRLRKMTNEGMHNSKSTIDKEIVYCKNAYDRLVDECVNDDMFLKNWEFDG